MKGCGRARPACARRSQTIFPVLLLLAPVAAALLLWSCSDSPPLTAEEAAAGYALLAAWSLCKDGWRRWLRGVPQLACNAVVKLTPRVVCSCAMVIACGYHLLPLLWGWSTCCAPSMWRLLFGTPLSVDAWLQLLPLLMTLEWRATDGSSAGATARVALAALLYNATSGGAAHFSAAEAAVGAAGYVWGVRGLQKLWGSLCALWYVMTFIVCSPDLSRGFCLCTAWMATGLYDGTVEEMSQSFVRGHFQRSSGQLSDAYMSNVMLTNLQFGHLVQGCLRPVLRYAELLSKWGVHTRWELLQLQQEAGVDVEVRDLFGRVVLVLRAEDAKKCVLLRHCLNHWSLIEVRDGASKRPQMWSSEVGAATLAGQTGGAEPHTYTQLQEAGVPLQAEGVEDVWSRFLMVVKHSCGSFTEMAVSIEHGGPVKCLAWSPNSRQLAVGTMEGKYPNMKGMLTVYDSGSMQVLHTEQHEGEVHCLGWSGDGGRLAVGDNFRLMVWGPVDSGVFHSRHVWDGTALGASALISDDTLDASTYQMLCHMRNGQQRTPLECLVEASNSAAVNAWLARSPVGGALFPTWQQRPLHGPLLTAARRFDRSLVSKLLDTAFASLSHQRPASLAWSLSVLLEHGMADLLTPFVLRMPWLQQDVSTIRTAIKGQHTTAPLARAQFVSRGLEASVQNDWQKYDGGDVGVEVEARRFALIDLVSAANLRLLLDCDTNELFECPAVRAAVSCLWSQELRRYFMARMGVWIATMAFFVASGLLRIQPSYRDLTAFLEWCSLGMGVIVSTLELRMIVVQGRAYLSSFWDLVDCVAVPGIFVTIIAHWSGLEMWIVNAFTAAVIFVMFFDALQYMRGFEKTAALVTQVTAALTRIKEFMYLMALLISSSILSFGLLFTTMDHHDQGVMAVVSSIIKMCLFGDFDVNVFEESPVSWLAFTLYSLFTFLIAVVMMNLLIAILGDSYEHVQESAPAEMVRVRAQLCLEMYMLLPEGERQRVEQRTRWLHTIVPVTQVESLMRSNTDMYYGIPKLRKDLQAMNEHLESLDQRMQQRAQQAEDNLDGRMGALDQKVGILDDKMEAMSKMLASLLDKMEQQEKATMATAKADLAAAGAASPRRRLSSNKSKA